MTGLEKVCENPVVAQYLLEKQLKPGELLPGWPGWDTPHLQNQISGGIVPTSPERLLDAATDWKAGHDPERAELIEMVDVGGRGLARSLPTKKLKCGRCGRPLMAKDSLELGVCLWCRIL